MMNCLLGCGEEKKRSNALVTVAAAVALITAAVGVYEFMRRSFIASTLYGPVDGEDVVAPEKKKKSSGSMGTSRMYKSLDRKDSKYSNQSYELNTHNGVITIDNRTIAEFAGNAVMECIGVVGLADYSAKDGIYKLLRLDNLTRGIVVKSSHHRLSLDFHIIVSYGSNIITVSDNIFENVKYRVEEFSGMKVDAINVYVDGVKVID